ncbi:MAG: aminopeptidase [Lachnospiraceae bacterium]|nr:aminopeptidase [Lachnospiraceae bacterium]
MSKDISILEERYELARERIQELFSEAEGIYREYIQQTCQMFQTLTEVLEQPGDKSRLAEWNQRLYQEAAGEAYETCFANPAYAVKVLGEKTGEYLCWYYVRFRDAIASAYEGDLEEVVLRMELFLQMVNLLYEEEETERALKEAMYYFVHDYDEEQMEKSLRRMLCPEKALIYDIVMNSDFSDTTYLYRYGEYITDNEIRMASFLSSLPEESLYAMAETYTEGYRKGFEAAGIDLTKKQTVQIRYNIGFEPMVRQAIRQFEAMGLQPVFTRKTNTKAMGVVSTSPNKQYQYDHRYDDALYLNKALVQNRLKIAERIFEKYKEEAAVYAGPAVIEIFGEKLFVPASKKESPSYTKEQEELSVGYTRDYALLQNRYIPQDSYSYTIIAYPIPEIGAQFEEIFQETVKVNTLDQEKYQQIQQTLIDALDQGEYVQITGRGENRTELKVQLHPLEHPESQTNFENCLADVNIPVGEVFTSPLLKGTNGVLHVSQVYLNELRYENLEFTFTDGMVADYTCTNYGPEEENRRYIKENILHNRDTLPMGEFAIGTNTTAYVMGRKYEIEAKLPILIAEKTGPHFALGDTCYSMSEDVVLHNPDGKEIIAKENECSALRHTDGTKAYFNCHTDITIPYDELGDIIVFTKDGKTITLLQEGRFVLPGTESLNDILEKQE